MPAGGGGDGAGGGGGGGAERGTAPTRQPEGEPGSSGPSTPRLKNRTSSWNNQRAQTQASVQPQLQHETAKLRVC